MTARRILRAIRRALLAAAIASAVASVVAVAVSWALIEPPLAEAETFPAGVVLRDREGAVMRVSLGPGDTDCRPWYVPSRDDWLVKAMVASEDKRFFSHGGADLRALARAIAQNVFFGRRISGASTITEQTTRLITPHPRTMRWKWVEFVQALKMERARSKDWILSQYLNRSPFGSNLVGAEAAAHGWFGKDPHDLSLGEAALLAGIVQAPSRFRPDRWLERALRRRDYVLTRVEQLGLAPPDRVAAARAEIPLVRRDPRPFLHPHYCDWAAAELLPAGAADFTTPLDPQAQTLLESAVRERAETLGCSAAAVLVDVPTGDVIALACSGDYFGAQDGQVNTALALRHAGSTLKPFVFARALRRGLLAPTEALPDSPVEFGAFRPTNSGDRHRGAVRADEALVRSLNIPFFHVARRLGPVEALAAVREAGFPSVGTDPNAHGLGIVVGNAPIRLVDLARAYAKLAREASDGDAAAWIVSDILSGPERSMAAFGHRADGDLPRAAWKTGTSAARRDAWTALWTPQLALAVWCGHQSGRFGDAAITGISAAAPFAWGIFRALRPDPTSAPWFAPMPQSVEEAQVCEVSGLPPSSECAGTRTAPRIRGVTPSRPCSVCRLRPDGTRDFVWPPPFSNTAPEND